MRLNIYVASELRERLLIRERDNNNNNNKSARRVRERYERYEREWASVRQNPIYECKQTWRQINICDDKNRKDLNPTYPQSTGLRTHTQVHGHIRHNTIRHRITQNLSMILSSSSIELKNSSFPVANFIPILLFTSAKMYEILSLFFVFSSASFLSFCRLLVRSG